MTAIGYAIATAIEQRFEIDAGRPAVRTKPPRWADLPGSWELIRSDWYRNKVFPVELPR